MSINYKKYQTRFAPTAPRINIPQRINIPPQQVKPLRLRETTPLKARIGSGLVEGARAVGSLVGRGGQAAAGASRGLGRLGIPSYRRYQSYKKGGKVKKTGLAKVHKGERVLTKKQDKKLSKSNPGYWMTGGMKNVSEADKNAEMGKLMKSKEHSAAMLKRILKR